MSWAGITWAYSIEGLSGADKALLLYLGYRMKDGECRAWPKQSTITKATGITKRSVTRATRSLEEKGLIRVEIRQPRPSIYTMLTRQRVCINQTESPHQADRESAYIGIDKGIDNEQSEDAREEEDAMKVDQILEQYKMKQESLTPETLLQECLDSIKKNNGVVKPGHVIKLYRALHSSAFKGVYQAEFTMKQKGLFTQMIKKVGDRLPQVIIAVLNDWIKFSKTVAQKTGRKHPPLETLATLPAAAHRHCGSV